MSEEKRYPSQLAYRFIVRLSDDLRELIIDSAKANNRSMNSEIVSILERYYAGDLVTDDESLGSTVQDGISQAVDFAFVRVVGELDTLPAVERGKLLDLLGQALGRGAQKLAEQMREELERKAAPKPKRITRAQPAVKKPPK